MSKANKLQMIITMVVIIIIIICIILAIVKLNKKDSDSIVTEFEMQDNYEAKNQIEIVTNRNKYFATQRILNTYLTYVKATNGIIEEAMYDITEEDTKRQIEYGVGAMKSVLAKEYIEQYNVTEDDILKIAKSFDEYEITINEMYMIEKTSSINLFLVYTTVGQNEKLFMLKTDSINNTFAIFPEEYINTNGYSKSMSINDVKISTEQIDKNDYNGFSYINITDQYMAQTYFNDYKNNALENQERAYNSLNEEYREKRFGTLAEYKIYVKNNSEKISNSTLDSYKKTEQEEYTQYVLLDTNRQLLHFQRNCTNEIHTNT